MFPAIFNITRTIPINIYIFLIDTNNEPATNVGASLINNENNGNNCGRDQKEYTLAVNCQEIMGKNASLFLVNNIYEYIRSIHLWLFCFINFIFTFTKTINSSISMICTLLNIFTIFLN